MPYTETRDVSRTIPRFAMHTDRDVFCAITCFAIRKDKRHFSRYLTLCCTLRQNTFLAWSHALPYTPIESFLTLYRTLSYTERCFSRYLTPCRTYKQENFLVESATLPYIQTRDVSKRDQPLCHTHRQENFLAWLRFAVHTDKSFLTHGFKTYVVSLLVSQKAHFLYYLLNILLLFLVEMTAFYLPDLAPPRTKELSLSYCLPHQSGMERIHIFTKDNIMKLYATENGGIWTHLSIPLSSSLTLQTPNKDPIFLQD